MLLILSGFMGIAKCVPGVIFFPFLSFLFLSREQHGGRAVRFQLWVQVDTGSSLDPDTAMLCDLGRVHFFLLF